jgi:hypothetical protein
MSHAIMQQQVVMAFHTLNAMLGAKEQGALTQQQVRHQHATAASFTTPTQLQCLLRQAAQGPFKPLAQHFCSWLMILAAASHKLDLLGAQQEEQVLLGP